MKKVSVMLPTYNAVEFIAECLESILAQDYPNVQIVISDDCSTDGTAELLKDFSSRYSDKIYLNINQYNLGITKNCNKALSFCDGEYVCFFAGDDLMLPTKISKQVKLLENDTEASFCYHRVDVFESTNNLTLEVTEETRSIFSTFDIIERGGLPGANSVMARKSDLPRGGYNEKIPAVSDWLFFIELSLRGKVIFCNEILARYRKHQGGCSAKADYLIGETLETVNLISRRFNDNPKVVSSCNKAKIRYLSGSIARLIRSNNADQLKLVNDAYIKSVSYPLYVLVLLYVRSGLIKFNVGETIFKFLSYVRSKV
ncbi:glycosyltransferase [Pseudomonas psychrophila]|uniref:Glycosyltransferase n=1 Tax=Pseudomonas psychrophila TaxID=122355 RepID=A0A8I1FJX0_9PSED|nr:glycosyltransferase [Pseudomonas psychrophila]MBJ2255591.1 glycosyltransferase [Pseudomonas psychrophila]